MVATPDLLALGGGGVAAAESQTVRGSGFGHKAIGNFDEPKYAYVTEDMEVTVLCDHGDETGWIGQVDFYLAGSTLSVTRQSKSARTGGIGFGCIIDYSTFPDSTDADLYAYIRPVNGYERRIGPLRLIRMDTRPQRYINYATGSDSTGDGLTTGTAWKTVNKAMRVAPSGAEVNMAAGTYLEDVQTNSPINDPVRPITFKRAAGLSLGDVVISQTLRADWGLMCTKIIFDGIHVATEKFHRINGRSAIGMYIWKSCDLVHADGGNGPAGGYDYATIGTGQSFFNQTLSGATNGAYHALVDSQVVNPPASGWSFCRGSTLKSGWDVVAMGNTKANTVCLNTVAKKTGALLQRQHLDATLTVSSVSYDAGNDRTTFTWVGTPTLLALANNQSDGAQRVRFQTGALADLGASLWDQGPKIYGQDNTAKTTTVIGDSRAAVAGDVAISSVLSHSDSLQVVQLGTTDDPLDNIIYQRYIATSDVTDDPDNGGFQPVFIQAGGTNGVGTVTTVGTALTCTGVHNLKVGDYVRSPLGSTGLGRRVVDMPTTTTATLASAFPVDLSAASWRKVKTTQNMAVQLCIFDTIRTDKSSQSQFQYGMRHWIMRQCTVHAGSILWRTGIDLVAEHLKVRDCIIRQFDLLPSEGAVADNNHFELATALGTNTSLGDVTFDASYNPTGVSRTMTPKLKWNYAGTALAVDGTALVGAV